ncbi:DUF262 domain-containing protein [Bacillus thuringiensis]|uniref:DUF262 domain-containing protein n=1 Tax=Bacillus thuringiensis TaxID=1428 RepID=UPI000BFC107C|nr:DUF262 domain-containing protein [Bacillus thuringiensis]PGO53060.1 hypothetical protein CN986_21220 [Bacillus thuringiensis]
METQSRIYNLDETMHLIKEGRWIVQPEYRKGEVWTYSKKAKLIDTILRRWYMPPIILINTYSEYSLEVLDGYQRLNVIMEFLLGELKINGTISPYNEELLEFDGLTFDELPYWKQKDIMRYAINIIVIQGFKRDEPTELFSRLNNSFKMTPAEKRDNLYGPVRNQVKELVRAFDIYGLNESTIGFSNVKMTYDDIVIRVCTYIEQGTLNLNLNSNMLNDRYRSEVEFSLNTFKKMLNLIQLMGSIIGESHLRKIKLNKASLISWLCFLASLESDMNRNQIGEIIHFVIEFEELREGFKYQDNEYLFDTKKTKLLNLFKQKISINASSVKSVLSRDVIIWCFFYLFLKRNSMVEHYIHMKNTRLIQEFIEWIDNDEIEDIHYAVDEFIVGTNWGVIE